MISKRRHSQLSIALAIIVGTIFLPDESQACKKTNLPDAQKIPDDFTGNEKTILIKYNSVYTLCWKEDVGQFFGSLSKATPGMELIKDVRDIEKCYMKIKVTDKLTGKAKLYSQYQGQIVGRKATAGYSKNWVKLTIPQEPKEKEHVMDTCGITNWHCIAEATKGQPTEEAISNCESRQGKSFTHFCHRYFLDGGDYDRDDWIPYGLDAENYPSTLQRKIERLDESMEQNGQFRIFIKDENRIGIGSFNNKCLLQAASRSNGLVAEFSYCARGYPAGWDSEKVVTFNFEVVEAN